MVYKTGWCMDAEDIRSICVQSCSVFYGFFNIRESSCGGVVSELYPEDNWYREKPLAYTRVQ